MNFEFYHRKAATAFRDLNPSTTRPNINPQRLFIPLALHLQRYFIFQHPFFPTLFLNLCHISRRHFERHKSTLDKIFSLYPRDTTATPRDTALTNPNREFDTKESYLRKIISSHHPKAKLRDVPHRAPLASLIYGPFHLAPPVPRSKRNLGTTYCPCVLRI